MLHLSPADNWKNVRRLVHHIRQRHARDQRPLPLRDPLQHLRHNRCVLRRQAGHLAPLAVLLAFGLEVAPAQRAPGCQGHPLIHAHGDDVALEVALCGGPFALVDGERAEAVVAGVVVGFDNEPGRGVGDAEVEDSAGLDEVIEGLHELFDAGGHVPEVDVELGWWWLVHHFFLLSNYHSIPVVYHTKYQGHPWTKLIVSQSMMESEVNSPSQCSSFSTSSGLPPRKHVGSWRLRPQNYSASYASHYRATARVHNTWSR